MLLRATLHLGSYIFVPFSKKSLVPLNCELSSVLWCPFIILANCSEGGSHSSLTCGIFGCFDGEIGWLPPFIGCCLAQGVLNYLHSILKIDIFFSCSALKNPHFCVLSYRNLVKMFILLVGNIVWISDKSNKNWVLFCETGSFGLVSFFLQYPFLEEWPISKWCGYLKALH